VTYSLGPYCGPGVDSACNRNEYQEYFVGGKGGRCLGLTNLQPSHTDSSLFYNVVKGKGKAIPLQA
jgi:hypothetical protein